MYQFFSKPDAYIGLTGHLRCEVTEWKIPEAPAFMRGLRVLLISDTHATARTTKDDMAAFARKVSGLQPELLLLGGDLADEKVHALRMLDALGQIDAPLGAFAVLGNNDREAFETPEELRRAMADRGITLLVNASRTLDIAGGRLILAGVDEYHYGHPDAAGLYPPKSPGQYRILLSHYPHDIQPAPDLMLSGHTHGGQFNALGLTPFSIGFERIFPPHRPSCCIAGLRRRKGAWMLTSKGIGGSRIPLRVGVRPEINWLRFGD